MKAWLPGEYRYVKIVVGPRLRRQFETGGMDGMRRLLVHQVEQALGTTPTSWKWEEEGEAVLAFLRIGKPVVAVRRNVVIGAAAPGPFMAQLIVASS